MFTFVPGRKIFVLTCGADPNFPDLAARGDDEFLQETKKPIPTGPWACLLRDNRHNNRPETNTSFDLYQHGCDLSDKARDLLPASGGFWSAHQTFYPDPNGLPASPPSTALPKVVIAKQQSTNRCRCHNEHSDGIGFPSQSRPRDLASAIPPQRRRVGGRHVATCGRQSFELWPRLRFAPGGRTQAGKRRGAILSSGPP